MQKLLISLLAAPAFMLAASAAEAQTRTWVSGVGDDLNPCSRTAPCKTFAGAFSKTAANGEINCLDPGGFGALTITKSITIDCEGTMGSILASNTNGIIVNSAGIAVTLRNLSIDGANTTTGNGIRILNAGSVEIDNVVIENFAGTVSNCRGITIETGAANVRVSVINSTITNTNNHGIHSNPSGGNVILVVDGTSVTRSANGSGIQLRQLTLATVNRSNLSLNQFGGGVVTELASAVANVGNSNLSNNAHGVINGGTIRLYGNLITGNSFNGLLINSGSVLTFGNNAIRGNVGNETPSGASLGTQ